MSSRIIRTVVVAVVYGLALTACGGDDEDRAPIDIGSDEPTASSTKSDESDTDIITLGSSPSSLDAEQQRVLDAYVEYWQVRAAAYRAAELDREALSRVAALQAASAVAEYVAEQRKDKRHTEGPTTLRVSDVTINGDGAVVTDCLDDRSADVSDSSGRPVERPAGDIGVTSTMQRGPDGWVTTQVDVSDTC